MLLFAVCAHPGEVVVFSFSKPKRKRSDPRYTTVWKLKPVSPNDVSRNTKVCERLSEDQPLFVSIFVRWRGVNLTGTINRPFVVKLTIRALVKHSRRIHRSHQTLS